MSLCDVNAAPTMDTIGNVRVSCLSPVLVRIEQKTSAGTFEERPTFMIVERAWPAVQRTRSTQGTTVSITTSGYEVRVPDNGSSISGTQVIANGQTVFTYSTLPSGRTMFPSPSSLGNAYVIADAPRAVPPTWGSNPMPAGALPTTDPLNATSGWDLRYATTPDVYVFVNPRKEYFSDYLTVKKEFLRLTGPIPIVPLYFLGFANSRYQEVTQAYAIATVDRFRSEGIPLDIYIVDTDWRTGDAQYSYQSQFFPNPTGFFTSMHDRHVKVAFNDHPQGDGTNFKLWSDGWTKILNDGLDYWWYDRNWSGGIMKAFPAIASPADQAPTTGIDREVWGAKMYYDVQAKFLSQKHGKALRPVCMSMRSGEPQLNNGGLSCDTVKIPHPAAHRYPGWWTGDTDADWPTLQKNIIASVGDGMRLLPHVQSDIAGHMTCNPGDEMYTRWMQYGAFCPQPRIHGTACGEGNLKRYPWEFTAQTKTIVTRYLALRYRLMPMMYTALRTCYDDGTPLLRRCDLVWPSTTYPKATDNAQYLFGDDILVKPVAAGGSSMTQGFSQSLWLPPGAWFDAYTGEKKTGSSSSSVNVTATVASEIWRMPMFVRQGAVIALGPDMQWTKEKPWDPVTLEVFPPVVGETSTRSLYEDDGETFAYQSGEYRTTSLSCTRSTDGIGVYIGAAQGNAFTGSVASRGWIVRLHLDAAHQSQSIKVDGVAVASGTSWTKGAQAQARIIAAAAFPTSITATDFPIPLQGEGQAPGSQAAGPLVEVWVPSGSVSSARCVTYGEVATTSHRAGSRAKGEDFSISRLAGNDLLVRFTVPESGSGDVYISLCNLQGEVVRTIAGRNSGAGSHEVRIAGSSTGTLPAGVYVCRLSESGAVMASQSVTIVK